MTPRSRQPPPLPHHKTKLKCHFPTHTLLKIIRDYFHNLLPLQYNPNNPTFSIILIISNPSYGNLAPAQRKEKKKQKRPKTKRKYGASLQNRGGKAVKSANNVTPAGSRRSNMRSTAVASAAPDYSSHHSSGEDHHSSGDEETGSQTTPWVRSNIQKLRRSNQSL